MAGGSCYKPGDCEVTAGLIEGFRKPCTRRLLLSCQFSGLDMVNIISVAPS